MGKKIIVCLLLSFSVNAFAQLRAFNEIFPNMDANIRNAVFSENGYVKTSKRASGYVVIANEQNSTLDSSIVNMVLQRNPVFFVESILLIPGKAGSVSLLGIYNALGNISDLGGRYYDSFSRGRPVPLFEDATRLASERWNSSAIPDPPAATVLPHNETIFIRLRDINFGNTFYRSEMALVQNGLRYTMSNFRNLSFLFVPVIREGRFIAQVYIEPIQEGVLIYSAAGADVSDFLSSRIHVESAILKRLTVITAWAVDGIIKNSQ